MNFTIKELVAENFKSFKRFGVEFGNKSTTFKGDNETGKSTIYDAILWCLIGKNSLGEMQFDMLPLGAENEISPKVELECLLDDKPVTLTRIYQAKFAKDKSFRKRETECSINGIAKGVRDFDEYISANIARSDIFRLLTNPLYFTEQMPAPKGMVISQAQRNMLYEIAKEQIATDKQFAENNPIFLNLLNR
jgi:DNA repair exonuclease SbcCD ATPase subunit